MAKLRKMLGDINDPIIIYLMKQIETQSAVTLAKWAVGYVEKNILSIFEKSYPEELRLRQTVTESLEYLNGTKKLNEVKTLLKEVNQIARETKDNPTAQAAARAIGTACSTIYLPTSTLGYTFYAVAAIVYDEVGLNEKQDIYDLLAAKEFDKILESLKNVSVENEENPVNINWNC